VVDSISLVLHSNRRMYVLTVARRNLFAYLLDMRVYKVDVSH